MQAQLLNHWNSCCSTLLNVPVKYFDNWKETDDSCPGKLNQEGYGCCEVDGIICGIRNFKYYNKMAWRGHNCCTMCDHMQKEVDLSFT